jgi:D-alanyl-D-alanine carboxypeptidase
MLNQTHAEVQEPFVDNSGASRKSPQNSTPKVDDIPIAKRDATKPSTRSGGWRQSWRLMAWGLLGFAIALLAGALVAWRTGAPAISAAVETTPSPVALETPAPSTLPSTEPATDNSLLEDNLLGHFPYAEAPANTLVALSMDSSIQLRQAAAEKFESMTADAEADGVIIVPVSGFRSIEDQEYLFFEVKAERGEDTQTRSEVSAPPGYSEHHTGYAVDVIDGTQPDIELVPEFEQTPAFQWLKDNAAYYSFELSFPPNNPQGVNYEPWHWRFVGDRDSLETFYRATQLRDLNADNRNPSPDAPTSDAAQVPN